MGASEMPPQATLSSPEATNSAGPVQRLHKPLEDTEDSYLYFDVGCHQACTGGELHHIARVINMAAFPVYFRGISFHQAKKHPTRVDGQRSLLLALQIAV